MVSERAETAITVATAQQMALVLAGDRSCAAGHWPCRGREPRPDAARQGLDAYRATGAAFQRPHFLSMLAEVHGSMGQPEAGLTALREALALVETTGEHYYEAELHRLTGELLLQQPAAGGVARRGLFPAGPRHGPSAAGESARAAGCHESESTLAAAGQACRSAGAAGTDLWLVHRGL